MPRITPKQRDQWRKEAEDIGTAFVSAERFLDVLEDLEEALEINEVHEQNMWRVEMRRARNAKYQ